MVTWILEKNIFSERCFDRMLKHITDKGIPYHLISVIPFIHKIEGKVPIINDKCVVYGSIGLQKLAFENDWIPGVWTNSNFNESVLNYKLANFSLNYDAEYVKLSEVNEWFKSSPNGTEIFIKPNEDTKEFAGIVVSKERFLKWYNNMIDIGYLESIDFCVSLSKPKKIGMEWRLVLIDKKVCECSIYKQYRIVKPKRQMNSKVIEFAELCANIHNPADVFVMDIADTEHGLKVIEYNTFNSAGLYDCDVSNIIDSINSFLK